MTRHDIVLREGLSTGEILIIQRIGRKYSAYLVPAEGFAPPESLADLVSLRVARAAADEVLEQDICDSYC